MLTAVDAISSDDAWAVGNFGHTFRTLTEHWDGTEWQVVESPNADARDTGLNAVEGLSSSNVWAVGYRTTSFNRWATLTQHWDGTSWSVIPSPSVGASSVLTGVSGTSASNVWAVGYSLDGARYSTLILHWNGGSWKVVPSPNAGTQADVLIGVAAVGLSKAWAVGYTVNGHKYQTLIERWNGTEWSLASSPNPAGNHAVLTAVDASSSEAWAVGYSIWGASYRTLTEHWDGAGWRIAGSVDPGPRFSVFRSVALDSTGGAWAVGSYRQGPSYRSLLERWEGSAWMHEQLEPSSGSLLGIAATSDPGGALAVGYRNGKPLIFSSCPPRASTSQLASESRHPRLSGVEMAPPGLRKGSTSTGGARSDNRHSKEVVQSQGSSGIIAVDEASSAGIAEETESWGAPVTDLNNDGWPDFFLGRHLNIGRLYRNEGGVFTEVSTGTFVRSDRHGCTWIDWNIDGLQDLFCTVGARRGYALKENELWVQQSGLSFLQQGFSRGLADPFGRGREPTVIDANGDDLPDLFVANLEGRPDGLPTPDRLYLNTGGSFRAAPWFRLDHEIGSICAQAADFDGDGRQDLLACSRSKGLRLYRNAEGRYFVDVSAKVGLSGDITAKDAIFADFNGDAVLDLAVVRRSWLLVRLQEDGAFVDSFRHSLKYGQAVASGDADDDGSIDLYVVEADKGQGSNTPDVMLINDGTGASFSEQPIPQTTEGLGESATAIDFNRNGMVDFIVLNGETKSGPVQLISFHPAP